MDSTVLCDIQVVVLVLAGFVCVDLGKRYCQETRVSESAVRDRGQSVHFYISCSYAFKNLFSPIATHCHCLPKVEREAQSIKHFYVHHSSSSSPGAGPRTSFYMFASCSKGHKQVSSWRLGSRRGLMDFALFSMATSKFPLH